MAHIGHLHRIHLYKVGCRLLGRAEEEGKYYKTGYILHHAAQLMRLVLPQTCPAQWVRLYSAKHQVKKCAMAQFGIYFPQSYYQSLSGNGQATATCGPCLSCIFLDLHMKGGLLFE